MGNSKYYIGVILTCDAPDASVRAVIVSREWESGHGDSRVAQRSSLHPSWRHQPARSLERVPEQVLLPPQGVKAVRKSWPLTSDVGQSDATSDSVIGNYAILCIHQRTMHIYSIQKV